MKSFCTAKETRAQKGENIYKPYGRSDMNFNNMEELLQLDRKQLTTNFIKGLKTEKAFLERKSRGLVTVAPAQNPNSQDNDPKD